MFVHVQKFFGRQRTSAYTDVPRRTRNVFQRTTSVFQRMSAYAKKVHTFLIRWLYTLECDSALRKGHTAKRFDFIELDSILFDQT